MSLPRTLGALPAAGAAPARPLALALGVFDGVHLGHRAVLEGAVELAARLGCVPAALAFDPPPEAALGLPVPERVGHPLERAETMGELGVRLLYSVPFTRGLSRRTPRAFVEGILLRRLGCRGVVVGRGFRFGAGAQGDVRLLADLGRPHGLEVVEAPPVLLGGAPVSSTRLRAAIAAGRLDLVRRMLGRDWMWRGVVVRGRRLGRRLGFPTANLKGPQMAPPLGVWAGRARVRGTAGAGPWIGFVGNVGTRPTVAGTDRGGVGVELHLLGFSGRLEGRTLEASFRHRLRPERKFPSLDALKAQIARDARRARAFLERTPT